MNILLVVTNADVGGAQKRIIDLATSYKRAGHSVTVASGPRGEYLPAELEKKGIPYQRFQYLSRANPFKMVVSIFEQWNFMRKNDFDVVHLNSSSGLAGGLAAKLQLKRPKTVFTFRGLSMLAPGYKTNKLFKLVYEYSYKAFLPFIDVGVFQCAANQQAAHEIGLHTKEEVVIRDGINLERVEFLPREEARKELEDLVGADLSDKKIVGTIGRLVYAKNYGFLIQQIRKLGKYRQDVVAIIIGDGEEREKLEAEISRLGLEDRIFLTGEVKGAAKYLRGFDVFTLPSRYEGLSMTLTEALHAGVPMLVSDVGCSGSVVGDERMVFAPGNALDFVSKLRGLLEIEDTEQLAEDVRAKAEALTLKKSAKQYLDVYERIHEDTEKPADALVVESEDLEPSDVSTEKKAEGESGEKRVLIFSTNYLPQIGGAELAVKEVTDRIDSHEFSLITARIDKDNPGFERIGNVDVYRVGFGSRLDVFLLAAFGWVKAYKLQRQKDFTAVWSLMASQGSIAAAIFARLAKLSLILTLQEGNDEEHLKRYVGGSELLFELFVRPLHQLVFKTADHITAISSYLKERAQEVSPETPITVIPNGVDVATFSAEQNKEQIKEIRDSFTSKDGHLIITTSRLAKKNAVGDLITATSHLPERYSLMVVGDGPQKAELKRQVKELGLRERVILLGTIDFDKIPVCLAAADVFCRPSLSEGFGNSFIEAMAARVPVVATPVGGIVDFVVDEETGLFAKVGDPESIAAAIRRLIEDEKLRKQVVEAAYEMTTEKYDWEGISDKYEEVINNLSII